LSAIVAFRQQFFGLSGTMSLVMGALTGPDTKAAPARMRIRFGYPGVSVALQLRSDARAPIDEKQKAAALRHGLATIPEAGRARLTSVYRSRMILAIDAR
jgi:hypothetical protein